MGSKSLFGQVIDALTGADCTEERRNWEIAQYGVSATPRVGSVVEVSITGHSDQKVEEAIFLLNREGRAAVRAGNILRVNRKTDPDLAAATERALMARLQKQPCAAPPLTVAVG